MASILLALTLVHCGDDDRTDELPDGAIEPDAAVDGGIECDPGSIPTARGEHATVADVERNRLITYGGNLAFPVECMPRTEITDEMWSFDLACATWARLTPIGGPGLRARHAMVTAAGGDRAYLFGGRVQAVGGGYDNFADVWELDLATSTFTELPTTGVGPEPRSHAVIAHDAARNRLIVFGGNTSTSGLSIVGTDDTWALDLETLEWSRIAEASAPPPRYAHAGVSDGETLYVFGGSPDFDGPFLNDTWALDLATDTWSQVSFGGPDTPQTRFGAALFLNEGGDQLLMVAGHDSTGLGNVNDLWTLDLATGTWMEAVHGDVYSGAAAGFCDFPADFTDPDLNAPERRHYFGAAQVDGTGYITMGKSDCGNVNDVWRVDLSAPGWELFGQASTAGEACNRSGATMCSSLCF